MKLKISTAIGICLLAFLLNSDFSLIRFDQPIVHAPLYIPNSATEKTNASHFENMYSNRQSMTDSGDRAIRDKHDNPLVAPHIALVGTILGNNPTATVNLNGVTTTLEKGINDTIPPIEVYKIESKSIQIKTHDGYQTYKLEQSNSSIQIILSESQNAPKGTTHLKEVSYVDYFDEIEEFFLK